MPTSPSASLPSSPAARHPPPGARWKLVADWAKARPLTLSVADRLGRSRGRLAVLDRLAPPPPAPLAPDLSRWASHELAAVWVGHATLLLRVGGATVLTDPVFAHKIGLGLGLVTAGPRRRYAPAVALADLPPVDLILLSHAHLDHLDRPTLARLPKRTPVITAGHTADLVRDLGYRNVRELRWGERADAGPLRVTAAPVAHWGARTFWDTHRGYNAYLIESTAGGGRGCRAFYGGDTAYHDRWRDLGPVDLAAVGIGAYDPYLAAHANPEQAWAMAAGHLAAAAVVPFHWGTFRLSHEPWGEPIDRFLAAAGPEAGRVVVRNVGGQWTL